MTYEDAVVDFLSKPENFPFALEIAKRVETVKGQVELKFWKKLKSHLQEKIKSDIWINWDLSLGMSFNERKFTINESNVRENFYGLTIYQKKELNLTKGDTLHFKIEKNKGKGLAVGIAWLGNEYPLEKYSLDSLKKLHDELKKSGYTNNNWWVGFKWDIALNEEQLAEISENPDRLIQDLADPFLELVNSQWENVGKINLELKNGAHDSKCL